MKFLVLGSGMMGYALAYDLARSAGTELVTLADIDIERAQSAASRLPIDVVRPVQVDVGDGTSVAALMEGHDAAAGAVSFRYNEQLTDAAIKAHCHWCDLGGNDDVVARQLARHPEAERADVTIIPNCGLAPGLVNILAMRSIEEFDTVRSVRMRVGGLPQHPRPPLNYQITFSVEGLLNEYSGSAEVLRNGKRESREALSELEEIVFPAPFGLMEAFVTTGGASLLPRLLEGKVEELDYKTVRYPGHCGKFRSLLEAGFGSGELVQAGNNVFTERELFLELLRRKLPDRGPDVVLLRVDLEGTKSGRSMGLSYDLIDFYDESANITAMMRMTSFPTSVILQFLAQDMIKGKGVLAPEQCVPLVPLLGGLEERGIRITRKVRHGTG